MNAAATGRPPHRAFRAALFAAALAGTAVLSLQPRGSVDRTYPAGLQAWDAVFHAAAYAALCATALAAFVRRGPGAAARRACAAFGCASLGAAFELAQALLPFVGRSCSLSDALWNASGAAAAALFFPSSLLLPDTSGS